MTPEKEVQRFHKSISPMERDMLNMLCKGFTNPQIAEATKLRQSSVEVTLIRLYAKIGAKNRANAAALWTANNHYYFEPSDRYVGVPLKIVPKRTSSIRNFPELW